MSGEEQAAAAATQPVSPQTRERSTIGFPYMDLKSSIELAEAIHANVGHGGCDDDQLAAWSKQSAKSSTFRVQIYAARTFGLLAGEGRKHWLTELGQAVVDPKRAREAKVTAFLTVPLYKAIYEKYKGGVIPPAAALERDIAGLGVAPKQKDKARQVFERSADQAGFFEHGKDRLVAPGIQPGRDEPKLEEPTKRNGGGGGGDDSGDTGVDPIIKGLLVRLPKSGDVWPEADRKLWLQLLEGSFKLIYKDKAAASGVSEEWTA
jgi:hypothetical protein